TIQRLQEEFAAELATLRGRVDALEAETAELRAQQFSTTTKLRGQVDANLVAPFDDLEGTSAGSDDTTSFNVRARLNFDSSFTGSDRLRVRLQARDDDFGALPAGGGLANSGSGGLDVTIDDFYYSFGVGDNLDFIIGANSIQTDDFVTSTIVPFDGPSVADPGGPVGYDFGMGGGGFAVGGSFQIGDNFVIDAGYSADQGNSGSNDPNDGGIFGSNDQSYIVQGSFLSDGLLDLGVAYLRGSGDGNDDDFVDTFMGLANLDFGSFFVAGYFAHHDGEGNSDDSWQIGAGFDDLFIEGSEVGVYYADLADFDEDNYMIEGYWGVPVNQFLTITPAIIYGEFEDEDNWYGALRATFKF
ncbi:MAG: iron uptake porin, partial [Leptolyngbyaceae cyanobacterium]